MPIDHWPMLYACFCLLDKVTNGYEFSVAMEEVCAMCKLNHSQRHVLQHAYDVLTFAVEPTPPRLHPGAHWG